MRGLLLLLPGFLLFATVTRAATPEAKRYREMARLPEIDLNFGMAFTSADGLRITAEPAEIAEEMSALEKKMSQETPDAERYLQLADFQRRMGQKTAESNSVAKAVQLARRRVEAQPASASAATILGRALTAEGEWQEAESVFRRAINLETNNWRAHLGLGRVFNLQVPTTLLGTVETGRSDLGRLIAENKWKPTAAHVEEARRLLVAASNSFERAVATGPRASEVRIERAFHTSTKSWIEAAIVASQDPSGGRFELVTSMWSPGMVPDFQEAVRLNPRQPEILAAIAFTELTQNLKSRKAGSTEAVSDGMPQKSQDSMRDAMRRLEELGREPNARLAAVSLEALAMIQMMSTAGPSGGSSAAALANMRRAVALDPKRSKAWDLLVACSIGEPSELLAVCEERVRKFDTPRSRLFLAKAFLRADHNEAAEREVQTALTKTQDDPMLNLCAASLRLKLHGDDESLKEASKRLNRLIERVNEEPELKQDLAFIIPLLATTSLAQASLGQMESARETARAAVKLGPENDYAREVLAAVERP
jgi:tetratricopeptide (TPR) repeat protein